MIIKDRVKISLIPRPTEVASPHSLGMRLSRDVLINYMNNELYGNMNLSQRDHEWFIVLHSTSCINQYHIKLLLLSCYI